MKRLLGILCIVPLAFPGLFARGFEDIIEIPQKVDMTLTVEKAVELALEYNLGLMQEDLALRGKKRTRDTAWNMFVPTVNANATLSRFRDDVPVFGAGAFQATDLLTGAPQTFAGQYPDGTSYMGTLGAALNFQLVLTPQLWYGYKATALDYDAGLLGVEKARADLTTNIKRQFYGLIVLEEQIKILESQLESIEKRYSQALDNYAVGFVDEYTTLSVKVTLENFKPQLEMARLGYTQALMALKLSMGIDIYSEIRIEGKIGIDPVTYEAAELIQTHMANRSDLMQLVKAIETLENYKKVQQSSLLPSLILGYGLGTSFGGDPWGDNWFVPDDWNASQSHGVLSLTLNMQLSELFPFSQTTNSIKATEENIQQTRAGLSMAWQAARMEIVTAVEQLNNSVLSIRAKELNVELAERAYLLAEEAYNAGGKSLLDVEDAEDSLQNARFQLLNEKYTYITALLNLEAALNSSLVNQGIERTGE